jgi:hypothetical protein
MEVNMNKLHNIEKIAFENDFMLIRVDEKDLKLSLFEISKRLLNADSNARNFFQISPSGYGIHWPLVDEDLSIDGLFKNCHLNQKKGVE